VDEGMFAGERRKMFSSFHGVFLTVLCFVVPMVMGCRRTDRSAPTVIVYHQITPQPLRTGPAVIAIQLTDTAAKPVPHAAITVEADMSHPGMAPLFNEAREISPGSYQASINFNMRGDWVVLLHIKLANGQKIEQHIDVGGVSP